jgi:hypothetical protein
MQQFINIADNRIMVGGRENALIGVLLSEGGGCGCGGTKK